VDKDDFKILGTIVFCLLSVALIVFLVLADERTTQTKLIVEESGGFVGEQVVMPPMPKGLQHLDLGYACSRVGRWVWAFIVKNHGATWSLEYSHLKDDDGNEVPCEPTDLPFPWKNPPKW